MQTYTEQKFTGERALFQSANLELSYCTFEDGESPLKECRNITVKNSGFKWKYPLWYSNHILVEDSILHNMARAGVWYTNNAKFNNVVVEAPKNFRRCDQLELENISIPNADETLWNCEHVTMKNVTAKGNYFAMGCSDITIDGFTLVGNYAFDGVKNLTIRNAKMLTKDAFWNCENVTVYDSTISGEYLGWNSKNVTLINCTIESLQGMCYMENLVLENCKLLNTNLAFEYSTVNATVDSNIESIKNPYSGTITANHIDEIIFDNDEMKAENTKIVVKDNVLSM